MPLLVSTASTTIQYSPTFSLPRNPILCLRNNFRINNNKTQQQTLDVTENNNVASVDFDQRLISKLRVKDIVDRIKLLPTNERSEVITSWDQSGDLETVSEFNDLLMALLIVGDSDLALKLFDEMPSRSLVADSETLSISIRCHCKNKSFDAAERVWAHMLGHGLHPSHATVATLVSSLSQSGRVQRALRVLEAASGIGFKARVPTYNCLLKGLCYVGRVEEAVDVLVRMKRKGSEGADIFSYTAVMNGLCKVGRTDEARELLREALGMGLTPDAVAFNTLFNGYCVEGRPLEGVGVLKMMKERDCSPDSISYKTLFYGLMKWGHIREASRVYGEMVGAGLRVEDRMVNSLLRALCWRSRGTEARDLESVRRAFAIVGHGGSFIDPSTYDVMIQTLCAGKDTGGASANLEKMIRMGYSPRLVTLNGVIRALCSEGKVGEALFILVLVNEGGQVPSRIFYNLLIHELNRGGSLFGARCVYGAALKRGIVPSEIPAAK